MSTAVRGPQRPPMGPGRGGPFAGMNVPAEKASNFGASAKRLLGTLHPERVWLGLVLMFAVVSVARTSLAHGCLAKAPT
ncbi:hypothetical protein HMI59_03745 [Paenarthrobacter sp. YJN-5]|nr:hypothetical protein HMI59_03745 [Paenarthrobacter sp. YJN-5]